jgi:hypothetical protein
MTLLTRLLKAAGAAILMAGTASAAPADILPLKHGRYVNAETPCREASRATTVPFNGRGFDLSDNGCRYASRKIGANRYAVSADCTNVGEGKSADIYEIHSLTQFTIKADGIVRRWCDPMTLPSWARTFPVP